MINPDTQIPFSGETIGRVPVEVAQQFGELMQTMNDALGAHLADPEENPLTEDFKASFITMLKTGGVMADAMGITDEKKE